MSMLFSSFQIGSVEIKNRVVMPPMCMYKAHDDANARCFHKLHYAARALGGVGLIIVEATAVEPNGRISNRDLGLWNDEQIQSHVKLVKETKKFGAKVAIQLAHAGRKGGASELLIAPTQIAFSHDYPTPKQMSESDIEKIKKDFLLAAKRAELAGYDMVEIHAAHGYLLNEFLSKKINLRNDNYGGSFENRARLLCEILSILKNELKIPVGVRLSASSWQSDDYDESECVKLCEILQALGTDFFDISAGGIYHNPDDMPNIAPLYQCKYAKIIKKHVSVPVIAVGLITSAVEAEALLMGDVCDAVAFGRIMLKNPNFALEAMAQLDQRDLIEPSYIRGF